MIQSSMNGSGSHATAASAPLQDWARNLPKVELHVHLEGAIPRSALAQLVRKYSVGPEAAAVSLSAQLAFRDFPEFLAAWLWMTGYLRQEEDFTLAAEEMARSLAAENVRYAEVFFSPFDFLRHGVTTQEIAFALRRGLDRVPGVEVTLVCDLVRNAGPARAARTLAEAHEARSAGIVGIGLGGSENDFPASMFTDVFRHAHDLGFRLTAHAGEVAGAQSVWAALDLGVDRIGHGISAVDDPKLVRHLAAHGTALEICPTSNLRTGVVSEIALHPIRKLFDEGVTVTLNSDDPTFFDTTLTDEYRLLTDKLGFSNEEIIRVAYNAIAASWAPAALKADLTHQLRAYVG